MSSEAIGTTVSEATFSWENLLSWDAIISSALALPNLSICKGNLDLRIVFLILEWSVHGIPWLIGATVATYIAFRHKWDFQTQCKMAILGFGIVLDLAVVGLVKLAVQRSRPPYNRDDQIYEAPVADKFSFPSGHSARAAMLSVLALNLVDGASPYYTYPSAVLFPLVLGSSRIIMGRHYLSDVLAGVLLGIAEGYVALQLPEVVVKFCAKLLNSVADAIGL
uniref:Phosphatidic acid phosphatase type 2/haloperoxidase domain-containing protein n=1 Tax=Ditylenchus dipsaci TaxID=166011 RepID=A0A915EGY7_9BILA